MLGFLCLAAGLARRDADLAADGALQSVDPTLKPVAYRQHLQLLQRKGPLPQANHRGQPAKHEQKAKQARQAKRVMKAKKAKRAVQAKKAERARKARVLKAKTPKNPPVNLLTSCMAMKENGAESRRSLDLADVLVRKFASTKLVFIVPDDPHAGVGYDAERQYVRVLLEWPPVKAKKIDFNIFIANMTDPADLPPHANNTIYVVLGIVREGWGKEALEALKKRGSAIFAIHDSLCFGCENEGKGGCPGLIDAPIGCPNLGRDVRNNFPADLERLYFTPWGSEKVRLYPQKAAAPTMVVDATKGWTHVPGQTPPRAGNDGAVSMIRDNTLSAKAFVESVHKSFPTMHLVVLGDGTISTPGITHHVTKLPRDKFQPLLRSSWFFATGIESSYELSISDAAMAGAVLVDIANASKAAVSAPTTIHIDSAAQIQPRLMEALKRYKAGAQALRTRKWALNFHGSQYLWLNLMCSLHADTKVDRVIWTKMQFNDTGVQYHDDAKDAAVPSAVSPDQGDDADQQDAASDDQEAATSDDQEAAASDDQEAAASDDQDAAASDDNDAAANQQDDGVNAIEERYKALTGSASADAPALEYAVL